jgi:hypothetical protein
MSKVYHLLGEIENLRYITGPGGTIDALIKYLSARDDLRLCELRLSFRCLLLVN